MTYSLMMRFSSGFSSPELELELEAEPARTCRARACLDATMGSGAYWHDHPDAMQRRQLGLASSHLMRRCRQMRQPVFARGREALWRGAVVEAAMIRDVDEMRDALDGGLRIRKDGEEEDTS